jgi:hypothetical protein
LPLSVDIAVLRAVARFQSEPVVGPRLPLGAEPVFYWVAGRIGHAGCQYTHTVCAVNIVRVIFLRLLLLRGGLDCGGSARASRLHLIAVFGSSLTSTPSAVRIHRSCERCMKTSEFVVPSCSASATTRFLWAAQWNLLAGHFDFRKAQAAFLDTPVHAGRAVA